MESNEWLLKLEIGDFYPEEDDYPRGYLTQLNKDGSIPKNFLDWGKVHSGPDWAKQMSNHFEELTPGWRVMDYRGGKS